MSKTKIAWSERVWNPVTGCTKVSAGCKNCYAEAIMARYKWHKFTDVTLHPERLDAPLHWRKPSRVFVNSMSDLFHENVPEEFVRSMFAIMADSGKHRFQILTKRAERMMSTLLQWERDGMCLRSGYGVRLPNVWLGVSVENQEQAMKRIPYLIETPAAIRWISVEPMLGPVDFFEDPGYEMFLDWVVVGGESGPNFRSMDIEWLESIVEQCKTAGVRVFVKQDSGRFPGRQGRIPDRLWIREYPESCRSLRESASDQQHEGG